jgi:hypothetical protein
MQNFREPLGSSKEIKAQAVPSIPVATGKYSNRRYLVRNYPNIMRTLNISMRLS